MVVKWVMVKWVVVVAAAMVVGGGGVGLEIVGRESGGLVGANGALGLVRPSVRCIGAGCRRWLATSSMMVVVVFVAASVVGDDRRQPSHRCRRPRRPRPLPPRRAAVVGRKAFTTNTVGFRVHHHSARGQAASLSWTCSACARGSRRRHHSNSQTPTPLSEAPPSPPHSGSPSVSPWSPSSAYKACDRRPQKSTDSFSPPHFHSSSTVGSAAAARARPRGRTSNSRSNEACPPRTRHGTVPPV